MCLRLHEMKEKFLGKKLRNYCTPFWAVLSIRSVPSQQVSGGIFACVQIIGHHSITFCCILLLRHSDRIPTIITMGSSLFCRSIYIFMHLGFPDEYFHPISYYHSMNLDNNISRKRSYMKIGMFLQNGIHSIVNHTICTYYLQFSPFTVPPVHPANMANAAAAYASRNRPFERNPTTWVPPSAPQRNGE